MAVVDPEAFSVPASSGPLRLAYVSAGEVEENRPYWAQINGKPFIVEANPDWAGDHRVDLRSKEWRTLLGDKVIPGALTHGYQGVMLDTLDVAEYLESKDPVRFKGSMQAAADFVIALRKSRPNAVILVNNALPLLDRIGAAIDGVVVEDLYTRCIPKEKTCRPTPSETSAAKEKALKAFQEATGKPVFVLLYANLKQNDARWIRDAVRRTRRNGFRPYLTPPSLTRLGRIDPMP